ncbi:LysE family translocator, partial [Pantoea sp. A4]|uniref:LysE family translocator n=1 Tax=Pantoea sp. A4 TaxID=1225184 RepID=UPI00038292BF
MLDITHFGLFVFSVFLLSVTPGPDMAYVIGQSVANGRRAGIVSALGVVLGSCTHAVASTLGLTALILASPVMFTVIKYLTSSPT